MLRFRTIVCASSLASALLLVGCEGLIPKDTASLLIPQFKRSEIIGVVAGFGTTFAAVPDMIKMFRRKSTGGIKPTMALIIGVFQILWVYYGLLILSRPVIVWNVIGVFINFLNVWAYRHFSSRVTRAGQAVI